MAELRYVDWDGLVYYDGKVKQYIADKLEDCIKMGGTILFKDLPDPSFGNVNYIYKIKDEFIANNDFDDSIRGLVFNGGTWVQVTDIDNVYLYTIFSETDITPVGPGGVDLSNYYTKAQVDSLIASLKNEIPEVPTKVSDLENDLGYLTEHQDLSEYAKKTDIPDTSSFATTETVNQITENIENNYVSNTTLEEKNYVTEQHITENYITIQEAANTYVTNEKVTEVVTQEVETVVTEQIETKVETVIQEKVDNGEIIVQSDSISYDTW